MSEFGDTNFIDEFAFRTKINYLKLEKIRLEQSDSKNEYDEICNEIGKLEEQVSKYHNSNAEFYEVTQLINSITGLLVFPQQKYFKNTLKKRDISKLPVLSKYILNESSYKNNYHKYNNNKITPNREDVTPANVLRHMRNALCHNRMEIIEKENTNEIGYIQFKDEKEDKIEGKDINQEFRITIKVEDLKNLLFEISDFLIQPESQG